MILDNACGSSALATNLLTEMLPLELMQEAQLVATDLSSKIISEATRRIADLDWADHVFTFRMSQEVSFFFQFQSRLVGVFLTLVLIFWIVGH